LIEAEKNNIYSNAIDLLYDNSEVVQYLPKKSAQDIFFSKKGKYSENRKYLYPEEKTETENTGVLKKAETENTGVLKKAETENTGVFKKEEIDWDEFLKQK
jgi:hypothetical protein